MAQHALTTCTDTQHAITPRWLTIRHTADYLSASPSSVRRMIARGEIPATKLGERLIRVDREALDELISSNLTTQWGR